MITNIIFKYRIKCFNDKYVFNFKNKYKFIEDTNKMSVNVFKKF